MFAKLNQKIALELTLLLVLPLFLAANMNLETSNVVIFPFALLLGVRIIYLFRKKLITVEKDLLDRKQLFSGLCYYALFTLIAVIGVFLLRPYLHLPDWLKNGEPYWFLALHALLQEFIFRVYALNRLKLLFSSPTMIVVVGALIFSLSHAVLPESFSVVVLTFVSGIFWSFLHLKYPNILALITSHFLVNLVINHF